MGIPLNQDPVFAVMMARFLFLPLLCSCGASPKDTGLSETGIPPDDTESVDADGDGFGADQDCNDGNAAVNPAELELCDGIDNDCDGRVDEDDAVDAATWHPDADGDGYGASDAASIACVAPVGHIADGTDCNDSDATLNQDDADADGYSSCEGDCDDANAAFHPGASSDGPLSDYDCDGVISTDSLAHAEYSFVGENIGDNAANAVSSAGDVDGDGLDDLWVGAWLNDYGGSAAGRAYLILGASLGSVSTLDLSLADYSFFGEEGDDAAGYSVANAGDVDGDGLGDLLVGAINNDSSGRDAGKAYLFLGASLSTPSTVDLAGADYRFFGERRGDNAGESVFSAGDVDGDGLDDLLVGASGSHDVGENSGKAYLILSASLGQTPALNLAMADFGFAGENVGDYAGHAVSGAGDVDGDGLDDLLVGAYGNDDGGSSAGKACLFLSGSLGTTTTVDLSLADYSFVGEESGDLTGGSVSGAGDVDGDGLHDLLVGASANDDGGLDAGKAYLVLGASLGTSSTIDLSLADYGLVGENSGDRAGGSLSSTGDVDGDGLDDLFVGAGANDDGGSAAGKSYLVLGVSLGASSTVDLSRAGFSFVGEAALDGASRVSGAGDVNGDGFDDLLVGAHGNDDGGSGAGKAYLILSGF